MGARPEGLIGTWGRLDLLVRGLNYMVAGGGLNRSSGPRIWVLGRWLDRALLVLLWPISTGQGPMFYEM